MGSEPGYGRPVVVVQVNVLVKRKGTGLSKDSVVLVSSIITVDKSFSQYGFPTGPLGDFGTKTALPIVRFPARMRDGDDNQAGVVSVVDDWVRKFGDQAATYRTGQNIQKRSSAVGVLSKVFDGVVDQVAKLNAETVTQGFTARQVSRRSAPEPLPRG